MIGYVTLGTNKFAEAAAFYDALLGELGARRFMEADNFIAWASSPGPRWKVPTRPATRGPIRGRG